MRGSDQRKGGSTLPGTFELMLSAKYNLLMNPREMAGALGRRGGRARAQRLSAARKIEIASLGGSARARSLDAARRIEENFRYVSAVRSLRSPSPNASPAKRFHHRLPGIYPPGT
jgi:hypothetical protein